MMNHESEQIINGRYVYVPMWKRGIFWAAVEAILIIILLIVLIVVGVQKGSCDCPSSVGTTQTTSPATAIITIPTEISTITPVPVTIQTPITGVSGVTGELISSTSSETTTAPTLPSFDKNLRGFWPLNGQYFLCDQGPDNIPVNTIGDGLTFATGINGEVNGSIHFNGDPDNAKFTLKTGVSPSGSNYLDTKWSITIAAYIRNPTTDGAILDYHNENCGWGTHFWIANGLKLFGRVMSVQKLMDNQCGAAYETPVESDYQNKDQWTWVAMTFDNATQNNSLWIDSNVIETTHVNFKGIGTFSNYVSIGKNVHDNRALTADLTCLLVFDKELTPDEMENARSYYCLGSRDTTKFTPNISPNCTLSQ